MKQEKIEDGYLEESFENLNCRAFLDQSTSEDSDDDDQSQTQVLMLTNNNSDSVQKSKSVYCDFDIDFDLLRSSQVKIFGEIMYEDDA